MTYIDSSVFNDSYNLVKNIGNRSSIKATSQGVQCELWHHIFTLLKQSDLFNLRLINPEFCQLVNEAVGRSTIKLEKPSVRKARENIESLRPYILIILTDSDYDNVFCSQRATQY